MDTTLDRALAAARAAATSAGVELCPLATPEEMAEAAAVLEKVWQGGAKIPADLLVALGHAGAHLAGARGTGGALTGVIVGLVGLDGDRPRLHSHVCGVLAGNAGVGYALKLQQRSWALDHGLTEIGWTFDPLVRRNAFFNLSKLGARAVAYRERFYGTMEDGVNAGDESDRMVVRWSLSAPEDGPAGPAGSAAAVLDNGDTGPVATPVPLDGQPLRCRIPQDIVALRRQDPSLARRWRLAVRAALAPAFAAGYEAVGMSRDGWYRLERP